jgi:lysyl-tRNA synthetase class 2
MSDEPRTAEEAIIEGRRAKAARVRGRGENPFANDVARRGPVEAIGSVRESVAAAEAGGKFATEEVERLAQGRRLHVCGRVVALRLVGGLSFARLRDRTGEIQLMLDEAAMGDRYERLKEVDVGDIVEASGRLTASKRGELSVATADLGILTKAYRPLPEKWAGLTDVELRYRQRYVDLIANPPVADVFRARSHIVRATREILEQNGFLEVETPTMHTLIGGATARPFVTHHNALDMRLFMRIAPELYLKRLVVGGLERVYEIGRCYRNEGISTRHNPEFTMLEFYQAYATYEDLMTFTEALLRGIDAKLAAAMPAPHAQWKQARPFTLEQPFARVPMEQAVAAGAERTAIPEWVAAAQDGGAAVVELLRADFGGSIKEWAKASPRAKKLDWTNLRKGLAKCESAGERLFACYEYIAEPFLGDDYRSDDGKHSVPVFIKDYPFEVSPLARRNDTRPELTDRFELFVQGREICNAFSELNDPDDQADRFRAQAEKKARGDEEAMDYDEDYVRALEYGMPPAAGFGMGIDRLVMTLTHAASIRDVILFPLLRPESGAPPQSSPGSPRNG